MSPVSRAQGETPVDDDVVVVSDRLNLETEDGAEQSSNQRASDRLFPCKAGNVNIHAVAPARPMTTLGKSGGKSSIFWSARENWQ